MIKTGKEHLNQLRDGRIVYIGNERVDNVTTHPAFEKAAKKIAELYDIKHQEIYKDIKPEKIFEDGYYGNYTKKLVFKFSRNNMVSVISSKLFGCIFS